jgi:hypothetical protein
MVAPVESGDDVEIVGILLDSLGLNSSRHSGLSQVRVGVGRSRRGARQRIQAYDALVRFRHDVVESEAAKMGLMETCKKSRGSREAKKEGRKMRWWCLSVRVVLSGVSEVDGESQESEVQLGCN